MEREIEDLKGYSGLGRTREILEPLGICGFNCKWIQETSMDLVGIQETSVLSILISSPFPILIYSIAYIRWEIYN